MDTFTVIRFTKLVKLMFAVFLQVWSWAIHTPPQKYAFLPCMLLYFELAATAQNDEYLASMLTDKLLLCICRNINCAQWKQSLHSRLKFYLDVRRVYIAMATNADQLKWRQIRISTEFATIYITTDSPPFTELTTLFGFVPSDEDTDVKALVKSWLQNQPEEKRRILETWLEDYFYKALDWVLKQNEFVVDTSLVGVVMNGLSHMHGVKVKQQFVCSLVRGLGANLPSTAKTAFAKEVRVFVCLRRMGERFLAAVGPVCPPYTPKFK